MAHKLSRLSRRTVRLWRTPWFRWTFFALLSLLAAEIALRVGPFPTVEPGIMAAAPWVMWVPTDSDPREASFSGDEAWGRQGRKVVFVGDSSLYGHDLDMSQTFPALVAAHFPGSIRSLNLAVPGYSSSQSLAVLEVVLPRERPELVVVANIWSDAYFDTFVDRDVMAKMDTISFRFFHHTNRFLANAAVWRALLRVSGRLKPESVGWGERLESGISGRRRVEINDYAANLERITELAEANGAEVLFLVLASKPDLDDPDDVRPWHPYRRVMEETAVRLGYPALRLAEELSSPDIITETLFMDEVHPGAFGHQEIARILVNRLGEWGWTGGGSLRRDGARVSRPVYLDPIVDREPVDWEDYREFSVTGILETCGEATRPADARPAALGTPSLDPPPQPMYRLEVASGNALPVVLDSVSDEGMLLRGAGCGSIGFVLTVDPPQPVTLRLTKGELSGQGEQWFEPHLLAGGAFDLRERPVWSLHVDAASGTFSRIPPLPKGWQQLGFAAP